MSSADFQTRPIFRRGAAPQVRLLVYVMICVAMLVADERFRYLDALRESLVVATYPMRVVAAEPTKLVGNATNHFSDLARLQSDNADLRQRQLDDAERLLRFDQLEQENKQLRRLLGMARRQSATSVAAEVLYSAPDSFSRKVILDQGRQAGIEPGLAVVDADGLLGQVTRVYPIQSEVTLITDHNQKIPVQVERNGLLGVTSGTGQGQIELQFVLANADIRPKDRLVTSGLDGVFLPGLPVAEVESVERDTGAYARILCRPLGGVEQSVRVLALGRSELPPPPPKPETGNPPPAPVPASARPQAGDRD